jgi:hypothetical protein
LVLEIDKKMDEDPAPTDVDATTNIIAPAIVDANSIMTTTDVDNSIMTTTDVDNSIMTTTDVDNSIMTITDVDNSIMTTTDVAIPPPLAPDDVIQPSMGSSRISGGILRGRAHGNILNHADFTTTTFEFETPVKGEVNLYVTDQYPRHVNFELLKGESELVVMVKVVRSMAPILDMVARKFSIIQSE